MHEIKATIKPDRLDKVLEALHQIGLEYQGVWQKTTIQAAFG